MNAGLRSPCFCGEDELNAVREAQTAEKKTTGYYGEYAKCRNLSEEEIYNNLAAGKPYVIRLKSQGSIENKILFRDAIRAKLPLRKTTRTW